MPHKRKRGAGSNPRAGKERPDPGHSNKRSKRGNALGNQERIPREFTRLISYAKGIKPQSGLDDREDSNPTRRKGTVTTRDPPSGKDGGAEVTEKPLKIKPGERLAEYSARVNAALPLGGLVKKRKTEDAPGLRPRMTKIQRRTKRMQDDWHREHEKIEAQREEAAMELEDQMDEALPGVSARVAMFGFNSKEDDPWAEIAKKRAQESEPPRGLTGLHDVVQAPPGLKPQKVKLKGQPRPAE